MKKAETHFDFSKICYNGYTHPLEVVGEAEGFYFPNATLVCKVINEINQV